MMRVSVVEDDANIAGLVSLYLSRARYRTEVMGSGREALGSLTSNPPDLLVLDLMLPEMDGLELCRALRADPVTARLPILILTARAEEADRVLGLELGADDYVTKPFSPKELVARVRALLRRSVGAAANCAPIRYGSVEMDLVRHAVLDGGREVQLTAKEFLLLQYFIEHKGRVLPRDLLLADVWGYRYAGGTRTVDVHVRRLREKLPVLAQAIVTIKQFGYKLADAPPGGHRGDTADVAAPIG
ncbi:MAG: response regulator transcription factor [Acidobacteria bacterium]|nr:response regulator transcription factor [Acidobacteriota bacterium]